MNLEFKQDYLRKGKLRLDKHICGIDYCSYHSAMHKA